MDDLRLGKTVRRIILLRPGASGRPEPTILYEARTQKKKQSRILRPLEKMSRRITSARAEFWNTLTERHQRSNEKKRNGWVRDGITNIAKASRKGRKQFR